MNAPRPSEAHERVRVAGFWRRLAAGWVDCAILGVVFLVLEVAVALALGQPLPRLTQLGPDFFLAMALGGSTLAIAALSLLFGVGFLYFFLFFLLGGQTPGKRLVRVRVIDAYGEPLSPARALLRTIAYLPSGLLLALGFLWIGFDREKRGLHDWLADTYVIVCSKERG